MLALVAQIFSVLLALIVISKSYVDFRARIESLSMFLFWVVTWALIVTVALFPSVVDFLLGFSGGRVGLGTFFGMAIVFLYFVVYRIYVKLERIEQNLTKAIQELALREDWLNRR